MFTPERFLVTLGGNGTREPVKTHILPVKTSKQTVKTRISSTTTEKPSFSQPVRNPYATRILPVKTHILNMGFRGLILVPFRVSQEGPEKLFKRTNWI